VGSSAVRQPLDSSERPRASRLLILAAALIGGLILIASALADTAPIAPSADLTWTDPSHRAHWSS